MRGPRPAYPIELTAEEVEQLHQLVRAHKSPQAQAVRARIILQASEHPESSNQQIAARVGTSDRQMRKWRKRWVTTHTLAERLRHNCSNDRSLRAFYLLVGPEAY